MSCPRPHAAPKPEAPAGAAWWPKRRTLYAPGPGVELVAGRGRPPNVGAPAVGCCERRCTPSADSGVSLPSGAPEPRFSVDSFVPNENAGHERRWP